MTMLRDYLNKINRYNVRPAWPEPDKCALLVIDMQQYFLSIATPMVGNVLSIIEACRSVDIRTIFTRHGHKDVSKDGGMLAGWWGCLIGYGSKDWELIKVFFVSDATATVNDELHVASLKNLAFGFAHIVSTKQLCRYLLNKE
jgi:isochorismate hydrolase